MSQVDVAGKLTLPSTPNGANQVVMIGAPSLITDLTTPTTAAGLKVNYSSKAEYELKIPALAVRPVDFGSIATGKLLYMGTTQSISYTINGGTEVHQLAGGGIKLEVLGSITDLEITGGSQEAQVYILILGD